MTQQNASPLKLGGLAAEAESENQIALVPLLDRAGDPYITKAGAPVIAQVYGEYGKAVRAQVEKNTKEMTDRRVRKLTPEQHQENRYKVAIAGMKSWNMEDEDGTEIPLTLPNLTAVCEIAPWLLDRLEEGMRLHRSFMKGSSTS